MLALKKRGLLTRRKRLNGVGQKAFHLRVSRRMIKQQAKSLTEGALPHSPVHTSAPFKASNDWLCRFMKQKGFSLRRKTTVCQAMPDDCIPKIVSYIIHLRRLHARECTYTKDETACCSDMPSNTTVAITKQLDMKGIISPLSLRVVQMGRRLSLKLFLKERGQI